MMLIEALAMPRNSMNPKTSVTVVTTTADATAGSQAYSAQEKRHRRAH